MSDIVKLENVEQITDKDYQNILTKKDIGALTPSKQTTFMLKNCEHLGIDPIVRPFEILTFQGKQVLYLTASGCENIAAKLAVTFRIVKKEIDQLTGTASIEIEGVVPAMNGKPERRDVSTAYLPCGTFDANGNFKPLRGLDFANLMMKLETKARRRLIIRLAGIRDEVYETEEDFKQPTVSETIQTKVESKVESKVQVTVAQSDDVLDVQAAPTTAPVIELYNPKLNEHKKHLAEILKELNVDLKTDEGKAKAGEISKLCLDEKVPLDRVIMKAYVQTKLMGVKNND
jgi:hypothetical protein